MRLTLVMALASSIALGQKGEGDSPFPSDAPFYVKADSGELRLPNGNLLNVGPGLYFNRPAAATISGEIISLRAQNQKLREEFDTIQAGVPPWVIAVVAVVSLGVGFGVAKLVLK